MARLRLFIAIILSLVVVACVNTLSVHGAVIDEDNIARLSIGNTTRSQALRLLGTPSSYADEAQQEWLYITIEKLEPPLRRPRIIKRDVLWLEFTRDENRFILTGIDRFTATDENIIASSPRITPSVGRKLTFIEDLLGLNR